MLISNHVVYGEDSSGVYRKIRSFDIVITGTDKLQLLDPPVISAEGDPRHSMSSVTQWPERGTSPRSVAVSSQGSHDDTCVHRRSDTPLLTGGCPYLCLRRP